jgi:hypothetical protein
MANFTGRTFAAVNAIASEVANIQLRLYQVSFADERRAGLLPKQKAIAPPTQQISQRDPRNPIISRRLISGSWSSAHMSSKKSERSSGKWCGR